MAKGLPLFIRDHFKLDPSYFCSNDAVAESFEGKWNFKERQFLTLEEKDEREKFSHLIDTVTAERDIYISEGHKLAMAVEGDDVNSVDTRLTKGNEPPPKAFSPDEDSIDASTLTGETRESKAKAYAAEATKTVSLQYVDTINKLNGQHENTVSDLQKQLDAALSRLQTAAITNHDDPQADDDSGPIEIVKIRRRPNNSSDDDLSNDDSKKWDEKSEDIGEDHDMTNLSETSSNEDNYPIMEGIRRRKKERERNLKNQKSPFRKGRDGKSSYDFNLRSPSSSRRAKGVRVTPTKVTASTPLAKGSKGAKL